MRHNCIMRRRMTSRITIERQLNAVPPLRSSRRQRIEWPACVDGAILRNARSDGCAEFRRLAGVIFTKDTIALVRSAAGCLCGRRASLTDAARTGWCTSTDLTHRFVTLVDATTQAACDLCRLRATGSIAAGSRQRTCVNAAVLAISLIVSGALRFCGYCAVRIFAACTARRARDRATGQLCVEHLAVARASTAQ